jgi:hypothetical protein
MKTFKVAAHYMLTPENGLQRWPLLTLNHEGCLLSWELFPDGLREQPFVQFYGGILIPAFIDVLGAIPFQNSSVVTASLDHHYARGTLVLGLEEPPKEAVERQSPPFVVSGRVEQLGEVDSWMMPTGAHLPIWERMKSWALTHDEHNLEQLLISATAKGAQAQKIGWAGRFDPGSYPGVLLLQNADLQLLKLTDNSMVKWLSIPKPAIRKL